MKSFDPKEISVPETHKLLLGGVVPRPIALVSTISKDGKNNLSPFSFFNAFGANPPVVAFSPSRRGRDGSLKDTYKNLVESKECVIQAVTFDMAEQVSLASTEYDSDVDEFVKSGLTPIDSDIVRPKRVKESPFQMECKLLEMRSVGDKGASANIAICEVIRFHVAEDLFVNGIIHPERIDLVSRMSANFYSRAKNGVYEIAKPTKKGIGYDQLPEQMRSSHIYSANNLGKFANVEQHPADNEVNEFIHSNETKSIEGIELSEEAFFRYNVAGEYQKMLKVAYYLLQKNHLKSKDLFELTAKNALELNDVDFAWKTAMFACTLK